MNDQDLTLAIIQEARICLLAGAAIKNSADPADALVILLSGPLSTFHGQLFDPAALAFKVKEQFGWSVSTDALEFLIPKFRGQGWLKSRGKLTTVGPFTVDLQEPETEVEEVNSTSDSLQQLGTAFLEFAGSISPIHVLPSDPAEAAATLLRFVVDAATPLDISLGRSRSEDEYLSARYSDHVTKKKLPEAALLESLTAVGFLFRVADEIGSPSRKRKADLSVVIDGPILLDLLGTAGPPRADSVGSLFDTLTKLGATLVAFQHSVDEAKTVLSKILKAPPRDRYGPTGDALRKGVVHENYLGGLLTGFDLAVRSRGIQILKGDIDAYPQSHQYFDRQKIDELETIVNWHFEDNDTARYRDVDTTALVIRRRAFHRTTDIFSSKFICVTLNPAFAGQTKRYLREINYYNDDQVPPVVTLNELSARAWIEVGADDPNRMKIPRSKLLLTCDRSLRLNRKVVERARQELIKSNPEQLKQFELLLEVPRSARALMDATFNNEKYVSGANIDLLVESVVEAAGREGAEKERVKRVKETSALQSKLAGVSNELETERSARVEQETARKDLHELTTARDTAALNDAVTKATRKFQAKRKFWRICYLIVALFPIIAFGISVYNNQASLVLGLIAVFSVLFGLPLVMDRPGSWLTKLIQRRLEERLADRFYEIGRDDLAEGVTLAWANDELNWAWKRDEPLEGEGANFALTAE